MIRPWHSVFGIEIVSVISINTLTRLISFIPAVLLARVLGQEDYGTFAYVLALIAPVQRFSTLGLDQIGVRKAQKCSQEIAIDIFRRIQGLRLNFSVIAALVWVLVYSLKWIEGGSTLLLITVIFLYSANWLGASQFTGKLTAYSIMNLGNSVVLAILVLLFVYFDFAYVDVYIVYAVYGLIGTILSLVLFKIIIGTPTWNIPASIGLKEGYPILLIGLGSYLYTVVEIPIVFSFFGANASALYKVALVIPLGLGFLWGTVSQIMYPKYVIWAQDRKLLKQKLKIVFLVCVCFYALCALGYLALSPYAIPLLFGEQYRGAVGLSCILFLTKSLVLLVQVFSLPMIAIKKEWAVAKIANLVGIVSIISMLACSAILKSLYAVAIITFMSEFVVLAANFWSLKKELNE